MLGTDPVVDYLTYIAELKEAQKIKVGTQDKVALRSSGQGDNNGGAASSGSVGSPSSVGASSGGAVRIHLQQDEEKKDQSGVIDVKPNSAAVGDSSKQPVDRGTGIKVRARPQHSPTLHTLAYAHLVSTSFPLVFASRRCRIVERPLKTRRSLSHLHLLGASCLAPLRLMRLHALLSALRSPLCLLALCLGAMLSGLRASRRGRHQGLRRQRDVRWTWPHQQRR